MLFDIVFVVGGDFCVFFFLSYHFSMNFPVSKQYSPRSNAAVCGVLSEATRTASWIFLNDFNEVISGTFHFYFSFSSAVSAHILLVSIGH